MTDTAGCFYAAPSRRTRFWRWAGFRFHLGDDVAEEKPCEVWRGWMQTRSTMRLDWADRLRILISGRLHLQHTFHMDTPSPDKIHTRFDWHILPPGEKQ
jgi:hypothetical protein